MSGASPANVVTLSPASAGMTVVSFVLRPVGPRGPWPLMAVLTELEDVERAGAARALGDRHGVPLIHSQELRWRELEVTLEARHAEGGADELAVELPAWDEIDAAGAAGAAWELVDRVAAAADAVFGCIGDGEAPLQALPETDDALRVAARRHLAVLVPGWIAEDAGGAGVVSHGLLPLSGLAVLTAR